MQRLSAEISGKAQKYTQVGPREFVSYQDHDGELTIEGIKDACEKVSKTLEDMSCDILASDQGPSCTSMEHIPDLKVIHVRFVKETSKLNLKKIEKSPSHKLINISSVPSMLPSDASKGIFNHNLHHSSPEKSYPKAYLFHK